MSYRMPTAIVRVILNSLKRNIAGTYGMTDVEHVNKHIDRAAIDLTRWGSLRLAPISKKLIVKTHIVILNR